MSDNRTLGELIPGETSKEKAELKALPANIRDFFVGHYSYGYTTSRKAGEFVGLVCRCCNRWLDSHKNADDCPVQKLLLEHGVKA